jgi:hypothetical protein
LLNGEQYIGQGVEDYGKAGWILDPGQPCIYNLWSSWLLKIDRVSGQVIFRERVDSSNPTILAWWQANGWPGTPTIGGYTVDP